MRRCSKSRSAAFIIEEMDMKITLALLSAAALAAPAIAQQAKTPKGHFGSEWNTRTASFRAQMGVNVGDMQAPLDPAVYREVAFDWRASKTNTGLYPPTAFAKRQEGSVAVELAITETGSLNACSITKASGVPSIDAHVCPHLVKTARFVPRMDKHGRNVATTTGAIIDYSLMMRMQTMAGGPQQEPPPRAQPAAEITFATLGLAKGTAKPAKETYIRYRLAVDETGIPTACVVGETTGSNALDKQVCDGLLANAHFKPAKRRDGTIVKSEYWGGVYWR